jgi:hypothetical protein
MKVDVAVGQVASPSVTSAVELQSRQWQPVARCPGVSSKELWRGGSSSAALIAYQPYARTAGEPYPDAVQHLWIVSGQARVQGRWLPADSYVHVPPGAPHPIIAGDDGCVLLQVHVPTWISFP